MSLLNGDDSQNVIASAAKQSSLARRTLDCFVAALLAMTAVVASGLDLYFVTLLQSPDSATSMPASCNNQGV
jgi:hypothetical protein